MSERTQDETVLEVGSEQTALAMMRQARGDESALDPMRAQGRERVLAELMAHVEKVPSRLRQRRRLVYGSGVVVAAAAAVALWLLPARGPQAIAGAEPTVQALSDGLLLLHGGEQRTIGAGQSTALSVADRVRTSAGAATLALPTGSRVRVGPQTTVQVAQLEPGSFETLRLLAGSIHVQVPKLAAGEYFAVLTANSKVVVHGTRFGVDVGDRALPGAACVDVQDGLVAVHAPDAVHWVGPGETWGCKVPEQPVTQVAVPESEPQAEPAAPAKSPGVKAAPRGSDPISVDLAEQNRLFQIALTHQRRGEAKPARSAYEELLQRFPGAPLAAEARVQLNKLQEPSTGE